METIVQWLDLTDKCTLNGKDKMVPHICIYQPSLVYSLQVQIEVEGEEEEEEVGLAYKMAEPE